MITLAGHDEDFAISISGEAILGITGNFKPIEIVKDPIVDESYIKGFKVGDRIRFRDGYKTNLDYELGTATITDIDSINIKAIWDGETDSDRYTKFHIASKQWWEKVEINKSVSNFVPSIDAIELPVFEDAIAIEPKKLDSISENHAVFSSSKKQTTTPKKQSSSGYVYKEDSGAREWFEGYTARKERDRYQFLLERREQLIESGACADGVWINCGKVPRRDFKQAVWKSDKPRPEWGNKKSQYIGKFGGDEHLSAIAQHRAGQELRKIEREIRKLQVK